MHETLGMPRYLGKCTTPCDIPLKGPDCCGAEAFARDDLLDLVETRDLNVSSGVCERFHDPSGCVSNRRTRPGRLATGRVVRGYIARQSSYSSVNDMRVVLKRECGQCARCTA